jgi:hypothetical protein
MPETTREMVAGANFSRENQCVFMPETFEMD